MAEAKVQNEKKDGHNKFRMIINNTPEFGSLIQTSYTSTSAFCDNYINPLFHEAFSDFYGSKIEVAMNRTLITTIAFSENGIDDYRAHGIVRTVTKESLNDVDNRIKLVNNTLSSDRVHNQYKLSQDAKDVLERLIPSAARSSNGNINWNAISGEGCITNNFVGLGQSQVIIQVQIDLNKLIRFIFTPQDEQGNLIKEDDNYQYMATLGGPINPVAGLGGQMIVKNWQLFILKLSNKEIQEIAKNYGVSGSNNLGFIC